MKVFITGTKTMFSTWYSEIRKLINPSQIELVSFLRKPISHVIENDEQIERTTSDYILYVISPAISQDFYILAEMVSMCHTNPEKILVCLLNTDARACFDEKQLEDMKGVKKLVQWYGIKCFDNLEETAEFLNNN